MLDTGDKYGKREKYINASLEEFRKNHGLSSGDAQLKDLRKKLELEAIRVYPMVNQSIYKERNKRAVVTFFIVAGLGLLFAILSGGSLVVPLIGAAIASFASVATIDISYNARVKAAMDSVTALHEHTLKTESLKERSEGVKKQTEEGKKQTEKSSGGVVNQVSPDFSHVIAYGNRSNALSRF